eukprot:sb/3465423/
MTSIETLLNAGANLATAVIKLTSALREADYENDDLTFRIQPLRILLTTKSYLQCRDPISSAVDVSKSILDVVDVRREFKKELQTLATDADKFTYQFLDCCDLMSEARMIFLGEKGQHVMKLSMDSRNKIFISHPFTQRLIRDQWNMDLFRNNSIPRIAVSISPGSILESRFGDHMRFIMIPRLCFIADIVNYCIFLLIVLNYVYVTNGFEPIPVAGVCALVRLTLAVDQCVHQRFSRYFGNTWNIFDMFITLLFLFAALLFIVGKVADLAGLRKELFEMASYFFSMATYGLILSWLKFLEYTSEKVGPLVISIKCLLGDIIRFVILLMYTAMFGASFSVLCVITAAEDIKREISNVTEWNSKHVTHLFNFTDILGFMIKSSVGASELSVSRKQLN